MNNKDLKILNNIFYIDARGINSFRISLSVIMLFDCVQRLFLYLNDKNGSFSILPYGYFYKGHYSVADIFLLILFSLMLFDFYSYLSISLIWILLTIRHLPEMGGTSFGFKILTSLLFWLIFILFSASKQKSNNKNNIQILLSTATAAFLLQLAIIYFSAGITKNPECWLNSGLALDKVLRADKSNPTFANLALAYPALLKLSSRVVFLFEVIGPILLFVPKISSFTRIFVASFFIFMHLGIALFMKIGIFPWITISAWVMILPTIFWDIFSNKQLFKTYKIERSKILNTFCTLMFCFILLINIAHFTNFLGVENFTKLRYIALHLGLDQKWKMFNNPCR